MYINHRAGWAAVACKLGGCYNWATLHERRGTAMGDKSPKNKEKRKPKKADAKKQKAGAKQ